MCSGGIGKGGGGGGDAVGMRVIRRHPANWEQDRIRVL